MKASAARQMLNPQEGYWLIRLVKGGPRVPACIRYMETIVEPGEPGNRMDGTRPRYLAAFVNGEPVALDRVWLSRGDAISEAEHDFRVADAAWAAEHAPDEPAANPTTPIDHLLIPLPF